MMVVLSRVKFAFELEQRWSLSVVQKVYFLSRYSLNNYLKESMVHVVHSEELLKHYILVVEHKTVEFQEHPHRVKSRKYAHACI